MTDRDPGEPYNLAKDLWQSWQDDPDSDAKLSIPPKQAIPEILVSKFGCLPREAALLSSMALDSVIERQS